MRPVQRCRYALHQRPRRADRPRGPRARHQGRAHPGGIGLRLTALAASGQPTARFVFEGFLPVPKRDRRERLAFLQNETRTMIFYEAPHKLRGTLDDLAAAFGAEPLGLALP